MQLNIKFKIFVGICILVFTHLYTYYSAVSKTNFDNFVQEVNYSFILFGALEKNKVKTTKLLLVSDINRIFIDIAKYDNPSKYISLCKQINSKRFDLLKKYDSTDKKINLGRDKIKSLCAEREDIGVYH